MLSDEAAHHIAVGRLVANAFSQAYSAVVGAVDEDAFAAGADVVEVEERLDDHASRTHERGGEEQKQDESRQMLQEDVVLLREQLVSCEGQCRAEQHGKRQTAEIDEAAVAEDAAVGVEHTEGNGEGDEHDAQVPQDGPEVTCHLLAAVEEIVGEVAAEDDGEVVEYEDAPIGQGTAGEVPVDES